MATGDDALAAGMDVVPGAALANTIDTEINKTRDYIAQRTAAVTPIDKGGTGQTTAAAARTALGITGANIPTGSGTTAGTVEGEINRRLIRTQSQYDADFASRDNAIAQRRFWNDGNFRTVPFYTDAPPATSGYTIAYINGDGRLSTGASSRRYKTDIKDAGDLGDLFAMPLREYRMRQDGAEPPTQPIDEEARIGYIAEELIGTPAERFVVYRDGQVESIDFIALLMAQAVQLATENALLAQRVAALEERA